MIAFLFDTRFFHKILLLLAVHQNIVTLACGAWPGLTICYQSHSFGTLAKQAVQ